MIQEVSESKFEEEVLAWRNPVLFLFYGDLDRTSGKLIRVLEEFGKRSGRQQLKIAKTNINDAEMLASQYGVSDPPHLLLVNNGNVVAQKIGYISLPALEIIVEPYLL